MRVFSARAIPSIISSRNTASTNGSTIRRSAHSAPPVRITAMTTLETFSTRIRPAPGALAMSAEGGMGLAGMAGTLNTMAAASHARSAFRGVAMSARRAASITTPLPIIWRPAMKSGGLFTASTARTRPSAKWKTAKREAAMSPRTTR